MKPKKILAYLILYSILPLLLVFDRGLSGIILGIMADVLITLIILTNFKR